MSSNNQNTNTTTQQQSKGASKGNQKPRYQKSGGGKRSSNSSRPVTRRYKLVPMDRDPDGKGAPPLVKGSKGAFLDRIHEVTGCHGRFLSAGEQRNFQAIEINTGDARIVEFNIDPEVDMPNSTYSRRLNKACQMVAGAIMHWRHIAYPPPEREPDDGSGEEDDPEGPADEPGAPHTQGEEGHGGPDDGGDDDENA